MSVGIRGKLISAVYKDTILNGIFEEENGIRHVITNAKAIIGSYPVNTSVSFMRDIKDRSQDYLDDFCLVINIPDNKKLNCRLTEEDFINKDDSWIFLREREKN